MIYQMQGLDRDLFGARNHESVWLGINACVCVTPAVLNDERLTSAGRRNHGAIDCETHRLNSIG